MSLNSLARILLPASLYHRLETSPIAKRLARGSLWSLFGSASSRILMLVAMILVARVLGQVSFGEFGLIQATLGVVGLMAGLGLGGTATRFVAQYAVVDHARAGRVIALVTSASMGTVFFAAVALIMTSGLIARTVLEAPHLQATLVWGVLLMAATAFRGIQNGVLAGLEKFDLIARLNILDGVVSLMCMVLLAHFMGVEGALLGLALGAILAWLVGRNLLMSELRTLGITVCYEGCWADWRILTSYSLPSLLSNLVATPVLWFCMMMVARNPNGYAELGVYNAAYQWHGPMVFIPMIFMSVSIPVLVQEWEAGRRERFLRVTFGICGLMLLISLPPVVLASFLSSWIMTLYGPGFSEGKMVLVLLLAAAPLHALSKITFGALFAMNRPRWVLGVNVVWGVTLLALTISLVPKLGVMGLAIGFFVAYAILGCSSVILVFFGSRVSPSNNASITKSFARKI